MNIHDFVNSLGEDCFDNNRQLKDKQAIYAWLRDVAPQGYKLVPHTVGYTPDGRPFWCGTLTITDAEGSITVPCTAEGRHVEDNEDPIGLSGVQTLALTNGVLRGLGAAEWAYERNPAPAPQPAPRYAPPTPTPQAAPARPAPAKGAGFKGSTARPAAGMRPWDGGVKVKSGEWAGTSYSELPDEVIEEWAGRGTNTAIMEKDRRMKERGEVPRSVFSK